MPVPTRIEIDGGLTAPVAPTMRPPCPSCGAALRPSSWEIWYTDWQPTKILPTRCGACGWFGPAAFTPQTHARAV